MPKRYEKEIEDILRGAERSAGSDNSGWQKRDRARWKQKRAARPWRIRIAYDTSTILLFSGVGLILLAYLINSQLHLAATLKNFVVMENHAVDMPWWGDLVKPKAVIGNGYMKVPTGPGWGTDLNEEVLKEHLVTVL